MKCILDSAVFINATSFPFSAKEKYLISSACVNEIREALAKARLEAALVQHHLQLQDPLPHSMESVKELAQTHGVLRLTSADESVIALALEAHALKEKVLVYTDDYSIQNVLTWAKIPFSGVLQQGIHSKRSFRKKADF